jgi:hypothetical protein
MSSEKRRDSRFFLAPFLAPVPFPTSFRSPESSAKHKTKVKWTKKDKIDMNYYICSKETHIKRQAIRHDCLPRLLGDGDMSEKSMR